jgi:hypothetical protein
MRGEMEVLPQQPLSNAVILGPGAADGAALCARSVGCLSADGGLFWAERTGSMRSAGSSSPVGVWIVYVHHDDVREDFLN